MPAIIDSTCPYPHGAVLYQYGTGPVKGFAVTLIAGIIASLISAIFIVAPLLALVAAYARRQTLSI